MLSHVLTHVALAYSSPDVWQTFLWISAAVLLGFICFWVGGYYRRSTEPCVADVADLMEQIVIDRIGEREFSRQLLDFDERAQGVYNQALAIVAGSTDPNTRALSYCWLLRHGYGGLRLEIVWTDMERHQTADPFVVER